MNEHRDIEEIISSLYEMIQDARNVPFSSDKCAIERDKALDILDELSNQLPGELKQAKTIVESRSDVIASAQHEADMILRQAQQQAKKMIESEEIVQKAEDYAKQIVLNGKKRLDELKEYTNQYLDEALAATESQIAEALGKIQETRRRFQALPAEHSSSSSDGEQ